MVDILGPQGKQIVSLGTKRRMLESRASFVQRYQQMHRLVREQEGATILYIGAENWPTPIPLVNSGKSGILIPGGKKKSSTGESAAMKYSAINVCQELVAAQKEYYSIHQNEYAQGNSQR